MPLENWSSFGFETHGISAKVQVLRWTLGIAPLTRWNNVSNGLRSPIGRREVGVRRRLVFVGTRLYLIAPPAVGSGTAGFSVIRLFSRNSAVKDHAKY